MTGYLRWMQLLGWCGASTGFQGPFFPGNQKPWWIMVVFFLSKCPQTNSADVPVSRASPKQHLKIVLEKALKALNRKSTRWNRLKTSVGWRPNLCILMCFNLALKMWYIWWLDSWIVGWGLAGLASKSDVWATVWRTSQMHLLFDPKRAPSDTGGWFPSLAWVPTRLHSFCDSSNSDSPQ